MVSFICPVCKKEVKINFTADREPIGGLYEVLVQHEGHYIKVFIDREKVVRRTFPVEYFVAAEKTKYTIYLYDDRAIVIDEQGNTYIVDPTAFMEAVRRVT